MKLLKSFTIAAIMACLGTATLRAETESCLKLHHYDGSETTIRLSDRPVVRVEDESLLVEYGSQQLREPLSEIRSFNVEEAQVETGLESVDGQSLLLRWTAPGRVLVSGAADITVYSVDGLLLDRFTGDTELNLPDYSVEILIIKADDKTFKITNKR